MKTAKMNRKVSDRRCLTLSSNGLTIPSSSGSRIRGNAISKTRISVRIQISIQVRTTYKRETMGSREVRDKGKKRDAGLERAALT